jgi:threonine dehydrogenase-like Zn-dependent dehydrogenase
VYSFDLGERALRLVVPASVWVAVDPSAERLAGRMFALCGLWYTDPQAFAVEERRLLEQHGDARVDVQFGCSGGQQQVAGLGRHAGPGAAVQLADRNQTNRQWAEATQASSFRYDIHGGGYPSLFRDGGGW